MSVPLDIDQLQTFIAIVDSGSFTKAAAPAPAMASSS